MIYSRSRTVCRPVLNQYVYTAEEFHSYASELFEIVKQGHLELSVHGEYPLTTEGIKQSQIDISELASSPSFSLYRGRTKKPGGREQ